MKRFAWPALSISLLAFAPSAFAQVFYVYPDAPVVEERRMVVGPYVAVGDNDLVRLSGYGRMGIVRYFDAGIEVLVDNVGGDWRAGAGFDLKLAAFPEGSSIPFDLSFNAGVGFVSGDNVRILQAPFGGVVSSPFRLDSGGTLVPYLGVYLLVVDTDIERRFQPDISDTDLDVEARLGLRYVLTQGTSIYGTLHLGRDELFYVGLNFGL